MRSVLNRGKWERSQVRRNTVLSTLLIILHFTMHPLTFLLIDKDYITYSEWTNDFGGAKQKQVGADDFKRLPFYCCNLSLRPFEVPVCTKSGEIYDFMQIIPFLRRNGNKHPITGEDLKPSDLIRLTFHRNDGGEFYCPITRKTLTNNSKIVVNKKSGQVYLWEAVETLNIEKGNWKDLVTEEPFTREDLIILQDPANPKNYSQVFQKAQEERSITRRDEGNIAERVNLSGGVGKVLKELKMTEIQTINNEEIVPQGPDELHALASHTTGKLAASLTSTSMAIRTNSEMAVLDEAETLARHFPAGKETTGTICIRTNFGDMFFTIFASKSPRCSFNFIELAKCRYYDGVQFHRFVKGFILQGGDPTGTGRGGESFWGKPFGERSLHPSLKHDERGILSMANSGDVNSNGSQFFITLRSTPHLDGKHPIFGKLLSGNLVLDKIEAEVDVDADSGHGPVQPIIIEDVFVLEDPFEDAMKQVLKMKASNNTVPSNTLPSNTVNPSQVTSKQSSSASTKSSLPQIGKYLVMKNRK